MMTHLAVELLAQTKDLASKEPVQEGNAQAVAVVGRDGNINVRERRVAVAESDRGDVDVRALEDRLLLRATNMSIH